MTEIKRELHKVSGGRVYCGYGPGDPCPHCGTPLVDDHYYNKNIDRDRSRCPNCGDTEWYSRYEDCSHH